MTTEQQDAALAPVLIHLFKGVIYQEQHPNLWEQVLASQAAVRDYVRVLGLDLHLYEVEGYAFLRQQTVADETESEALPRLVARRQLTYPVSLLLALLRKRLAEQDASGGDTRTVVTRQQLLDMMQVFMPEQSNEAKLQDQMNAAINKVLEYGFLRELKQDDGALEIRRILKAFVDAQWLGMLEEKLAIYRDYAVGEAR